MNDQTQLRGACLAPSNDKSRQWAETSLDRELSVLANMPEGTNINKPGSLLYVSLLKIASIVKGGYVPEHEALNGVKKSLCAFTWIPQKEIDYQWQRAYRKAEPRHPAQQNRPPMPMQIKSDPPKDSAWQITQYDLSTHEETIVRTIQPETVSKARYLAGIISEYLESGELPKSLNFSIAIQGPAVNGQIVRIRFQRYTPALAECVFVAVLMVGCRLWFPLSDYTHGWFDFFVPVGGAFWARKRLGSSPLSRYSEIMPAR